MFGLVFMKIRKLKSLHQENKKLDLHKTKVFSLHKSFENDLCIHRNSTLEASLKLHVT